ncbi:MAG TPA: glycoside hydrolase family 2 TIM barrel-domain containing protein [Candidatus Eisenbacteria bacterium]|nr:glycoside hydrolase family 2 TIM barrel-domain containing protein [Candidatus Eisenbacteria bacterium]
MSARAFAAGLLFFLTAAPAGASDVRVTRDDAGWTLRVDGEPYFVRGVDYRVTKIGQGPDDGTLEDWATYDADGDGKNDPAYQAWIDADGDGRRGADEAAVGDFELMKRMGVNTIRWYVNDFKNQAAHKELLRDLTAGYGIRVAVGNKFGAYTIDSGASWEAGTDYRDPEQRRRLLDSVRRMALEHKDEPYTLLWLLGNENNLPFTNTNAARFPEAYATLVEEAAKLLHELDGRHPVAVVNGDTKGIGLYRKYCPHVDIFGVNAYRGPKGFGGLWLEAKKQWGGPVLVTEYGGSYANGLDEDAQADYHKGCVSDIAANAAGRGAGNALGGFAFEWLDEWWKAGDPSSHAEKGTSGRQGTGGASWTQEYCGLLSQGDGRSSPLGRRTRKVYGMYREAWARK